MKKGEIVAMLRRNKFLLILSISGILFSFGVSYFIGFTGLLVLTIGSMAGLIGHSMDSKK